MYNSIKKFLSFVCVSLLLFSCACQGNPPAENSLSTNNSIEAGNSDKDSTTSESNPSENEETPPKDNENNSDGGEETPKDEETPHVHVPNEDDGDCTTPIYCSNCEDILTAGIAHVFDNDCDTDCNNAGCEHERTTIGHVDENGDKKCDSCQAKLSSSGGSFELPDDKFD